MTASLASRMTVGNPRHFTDEQLQKFLSVRGVRRVMEHQFGCLDNEGNLVTLDLVLVYVPFWYMFLPKWFRRRLHIRITDAAPGGVVYQLKYEAFW